MDEAKRGMGWVTGDGLPVHLLGGAVKGDVGDGIPTHLVFG